MPKIVDHNERRLEIARATCAAVCSIGVENLTLRDIATEAGFTTGVFSHYFKDKNSVLRFAFSIAWQNVHDRIIASNEGSSSDLVRIRNAMIELLPDHDIVESVAFVAMCFRVRDSNDPLLAIEYGTSKNRYRELMDGYVASAIGNREISGERKTRGEVVDLILAVVDGVCIEALLDPKYHTNDRCVRIIDNMLSGLSEQHQLEYANRRTYRGLH